MSRILAHQHIKLAQDPDRPHADIFQVPYRSDNNVQSRHRRSEFLAGGLLRRGNRNRAVRRSAGHNEFRAAKPREALLRLAALTPRRKPEAVLRSLPLRNSGSVIGTLVFGLAGGVGASYHKRNSVNGNYFDKGV